MIELSCHYGWLFGMPFLFVFFGLVAAVLPFLIGVTAAHDNTKGKLAALGLAIICYTGGTFFVLAAARDFSTHCLQ